MAAFQALLMGGFWMSWAYLGGLVFAAVVLARGREGVRRTAGWSIFAQLAPIAMALLLAPVAILELSFDREVIPGAVLGALTMGSLFAGPVMTVVLLAMLRSSRKSPPNTSLQSLFAIGLCCSMFLTACDAEPERAAPTPAKKVSAVNPASDAEASAPVVLTAADLRRVCQAGLAAIHGQGVVDIEIDRLEGRVVNASWRAPVDGGRRRAQCRVDGDLVIWKPVDRIRPEDDRWMDQAGDPVTRFVLDGETVTINQTLPDSGAVADDQGRG
jgi:hypothetical protein